MLIYGYIGYHVSNKYLIIVRPIGPILYIYKTLGLLPVEAKTQPYWYKGVWVISCFRVHSSKWQFHFSPRN